MLRTLGIDPGKTGALAMITPHGHMAADTPTITMNGKKIIDERRMVEVFRSIVAKKPIFVFLEMVHAMPKQGVVSMFTFGKSFGIWLGILASHDVPYELVTPQKWKAQMLAGVEGTDNKAKSVIVAKRLFPENSGWKKKDHNKAEALLIAEWGRRKLYATTPATGVS